ncbi:MAG: hypothetical protein HY529_06485 [Chloroflexi bacterium]|nr:hypothetical protein [Chloroflexota bacterium]
MAEVLGMTPEVTVKADETGTPESLSLKSNRCKVVRVYDRWRIADSWWAEEVSRDYFRVELGNGSVCNIYHDMMTDRWYLTRSYG